MTRSLPLQYQLSQILTLSPAGLLAVNFSICFLVYYVASKLYQRIADPLKHVPRIKVKFQVPHQYIYQLEKTALTTANTQFPTWKSQLEALVELPDPEFLRQAVNTTPNDGFLQYRGNAGHPTLLVTRPDLLHEILVTQSYDFQHAELVRKTLRMATGNGLLVAEGAEHKAQRRKLMPAFSPAHVRSLVPLFWSKSVELIDRLGVENDSSTQSTCLYSWISRAALDIIGVTAWGRDFNSLAEPHSSLVTKYRMMFVPETLINAVARMLVPISMLIRLPIKTPRNALIGTTAMREAAQEAVREVVAKRNNERHLLSVAARSGEFNEEQLVEQMLTMVAAGHETSATSTTWACYYLALNPHVQTQLRQEIREKLPSPKTDQEMTSEQLESVNFLRATVLEALRMVPPVAAPRRVASKNTIIGNQAIPKGTEVLNCLWISGRLGWERPESFEPERWIDASGRLRSFGTTGNPGFSPFSQGPRVCIGQSFARLEEYALLAALVGRFELSLVDGAKKPECTFRITTLPKEPIMFNVRAVDGW